MEDKVVSLTRLPGDQKMNVLYQENTEGKHDLSPDIRVLIERIPLFHVSETVRVEPLSGGASLNNANYCLTWHDQKYVLRVALEAARRNHAVELRGHGRGSCIFIN